MKSDNVNQAVTILEENRLANTALDKLNSDVRPLDMGAAYKIQNSLNDKLSRSRLGSRSGYKIGCTTPVLQRYLDIHEPIYGEIFSSTIFRDTAVLDLANYVQLGIEAEMAVRLDTNLPNNGDPYDFELVVDAIDSVMISIELVDARYKNFEALDTPTLTADNFFNAGIVLGRPIADWHKLDLASLEAFVTLNSKELGHGKSSLIMGHPLNALTWLANKLCEQGRMLRGGNIVTLGSMVKTHWVKPGDTLHHHMAGLGSVSVTVRG
ncbi:MAG: fumarylacetoacetate hydrolase family protein [Pseudomonadota bacterium]|nr:fumarylacetoacetate hydrolase family protein [Pseudomonadota bacterium]